jgi:hypothetical protein
LWELPLDADQVPGGLDAQGRLKAKQPWHVGLVYRSQTGERRLRHGGGRLTDFGFAPKWD